MNFDEKYKRSFFPIDLKGYFRYREREFEVKAERSEAMFPIFRVGQELHIILCFDFVFGSRCRPLPFGNTDLISRYKSKFLPADGGFGH